MNLRLLAITDDRHSVQELVSIILSIKDSIDFVHIREKSKSVQELLLLIGQLTAGGLDPNKLVINDRLDIALLRGIPNIHLPSHGLPAKEVREHFPHMKIGRSVHSFKEAMQAENDGADYILYGHIYRTDSKRGKAPRGLTELLKIKKELNIPVYAIGGIAPEQIDDLKGKSIDGVAVMSGIFSANDPGTASKQYFKKCREEKNEKIL